MKEMNQKKELILVIVSSFRSFVRQVPHFPMQFHLNFLSAKKRIKSGKMIPFSFFFYIFLTKKKCHNEKSHFSISFKFIQQIKYELIIITFTMTNLQYFFFFLFFSFLSNLSVFVYIRFVFISRYVKSNCWNSRWWNTYRRGVG